MRCPKCGRQYRQIQEFKAVRGFGLALYALCGGCQNWMPVNSIWQRVRVQAPVRVNRGKVYEQKTKGDFRRV